LGGLLGDFDFFCFRILGLELRRFGDEDRDRDRDRDLGIIFEKPDFLPRDEDRLFLAPTAS
jgi:hypothetical protein